MALGNRARIVLGVLGGGLVMVGLLGMLRGVMALIDPSVQMSDDGNPFAPPPAFEYSAWLTGAAVCAFLLGSWLCVRLARES